MQITTGKDILAERKRRGIPANGFCRLSGIDRNVLRACESGGCLPTQDTIDKALVLFELYDRKQQVAVRALADTV
jgi:hypothetical protein